MWSPTRAFGYRKTDFNSYTSPIRTDFGRFWGYILDKYYVGGESNREAKREAYCNTLLYSFAEGMVNIPFYILFGPGRLVVEFSKYSKNTPNQQKPNYK